MTKTPTYRTWERMKQRCRNPASIDYPRYGGRGIAICDAWRYFPAFLADMGTRLDGCSLDRIDNNGPYAPGNCRWATTRQQANNRRTNHTVIVNGKPMTLAEACAHADHGLTTRIVRSRVDSGWDIDAALRTPKANTGPKAIGAC